jgi:hypothetical protein
MNWKGQGGRMDRAEKSFCDGKCIRNCALAKKNNVTF